NELGDFAGKKVPGIAPLVFNTRARYGSTSGLSAEITIEHIGSYYANDANTAEVSFYLILHGSMGYAFRVGKFDMHALIGVNNLTDQHYIASSFINPATRTADGKPLSPAFIEPGLPANAFASLNIRTEL
ncbi:MAG: hypothetical protein ACRDGA_04015, partial [Bacteroidota bacterium]